MWPLSTPAAVTNASWTAASDERRVRDTAALLRAFTEPLSIATVHRRAQPLLSWPASATDPLIREPLPCTVLLYPSPLPLPLCLLACTSRLLHKLYVFRIP